MTDNLPSIPKPARSAWSIVKAVGPFLISQAEKASETYAKHQMRMAQVEACKELMISEIRTLTDIRRKLIERYYETPIEERFGIQRDVGDLDKEIRRLGIYQKALEYLPGDAKDKSQTNESDTSQNEISRPWIDRFNEIARLQNEEWRQDLLSKALAREAHEPGAISPRALWFIGTVDAHIFHAFASLIDISAVVLGRYMIPNHASYYQRTLPNCALGENYLLGNVTFMLSDLGLMGDLLTSQRVIPAGGQFRVGYGSKYCLLKTKTKLDVTGILLTHLGDVIASLYEQKVNELGQEIFDTWIKGIDQNIAEVQC